MNLGDKIKNRLTGNQNSDYFWSIRKKAQSKFFLTRYIYIYIYTTGTYLGLMRIVLRR